MDSSNNNIEPERSQINTDPNQEVLNDWGKIIWTLLHTLIEHMNEDHFHIYRDELLYIVYCICTSLPCDMCNKHSIKYLDETLAFLQNVKEESTYRCITSKEQLRVVFVEFHNNVNTQIGKSTITIEECIETFSSLNVVTVVRDYIELSKTFMRHGYSTLIKYLLEKNLKYFISK